MAQKVVNDLRLCSKRMKKDGITLEQIEAELDYRDRTGDSNHWDDDLFEYSADELETIAYELWDKDE